MCPFSKSALTAICLGLLAAVTTLTSGCITILHSVTVDAITDPAAPRSFSYQLAPARPALVREARIHNFAVACIREALAARGLYEQTSADPPDIVIEYDYGIGESIPLPNSAPMMEKFLSLSARPFSTNLASRGDEVWNVRVVAQEAGAGVERALPMLAAVAVDYAGMDTGTETTISVPDNSAAIVQVRNAATAAVGGTP